MLVAPSRLAVQNRPPPLWFVSNGELTVGPVRTHLLQRGVWFQRIPEDCWVRELTWKSWRRLDEIREVRTVLRAMTTGASWTADPRETEREARVQRFRRGSDTAEMLSFALHECVEQTGASFGLLHRPWGSSAHPVTTAVRGIGMTVRLGKSVPPSDPVVALARVGGVVVSPPNAGAVERSIAERFGSPADLSGVAMVPVSVGRSLVAVIELGRVGHSFRSADVGIISDIAEAAVAAIVRF